MPLSAHHSSLPPPQPIGTRWLDALRFFSPKTWWGFYKYIDASPFAPLESHKFVEGLMGLLIPMALLILLQHQILQPNRLLLPCYLVSPWSWHCLLVSMGTPVRQLAKAGWQQRSLRAPPLPEAMNVLQELVVNEKSSRAIRTRRYDLYLPPNRSNNNATIKGQKEATNNNNNEDQKQKAIVLLPGAGVDHASYAPVAKLFSDAGFIVIVPSLEPLRLARPSQLGCNLQNMCRIMSHAETKFIGNACQWTFVGHSLSSFAVMNMAYELYQLQNHATTTATTINGIGTTKPNNKHYQVDISNKIVLWATMYLPQFATSLKNTPIEMLLIQGDKDNLLELTKQWRTVFLSTFISKVCTHITLKGGTHSGFASYQAAVPEVGAGKGILSRQRQQQLACRETIKFLTTRHRGGDQDDLQKQQELVDPNSFFYPRYQTIYDI